jgi:regulator of RNase E activity RraA
MPETIIEYSKEFASLPTSAVGDALDQRGIKGHCKGLHALDPRAGKLCGRVFTVQFLPCGTPDARTPDGDLGDYLDDVPAGYVIAIDNRANLDSSVWDDTLTRIARERGIAGTVVDGACRDSAGIARRQYPVFAAGTASRNGRHRVRVEAYNLPVAIGGVRVECDDILLGDEDGLVVIPRDHLGPVLAAARENVSGRK